MKISFKKIMIIVVAVTMIFVAGCNNTDTPAQGETSPVTPEITMEPATSLEDYGTFISVISENGSKYDETADGNIVVKQAIIAAIARDRGIALDMEVIVLPEIDYIGEFNKILSSGKAVDSATFDYSWFATFASSGTFVPLDSQLQTYGQNIINTIDIARWEETMFNNEIFAIPGARLPEKTILVTRGDMRVYTGFDAIETREEFLAACSAYNAMGMTALCLTWDQILDVLAYSFHIPTTQYNIEQPNSKVQLREFDYYYERDFLETMRDLYTRGLLHPDVFTATKEDMRAEVMAGTGMIYATEYEDLITDYNELLLTVPSAKFEVIKAPTYRRMAKPRLSGETAVNSVLMCAVTGTHIPALLTYKDWAISDRVNYTMTKLGVFGDHINYNNAGSEFTYAGDYSKDNVPYNGVYGLGISMEGLYPPVLEKPAQGESTHDFDLIRTTYNYLSTASVTYEPQVELTDQTQAYFSTYRSIIDEAVIQFIKGEITPTEYNEEFSKAYTYAEAIKGELKPKLYQEAGIVAQ